MCRLETISTEDVFLAQPATLLSVVLRREHITRYLACPDALASMVVTGSTGPGALASRYLRDFWERAEHELTRELAPRFAEAALQIVASAYAGMPDARPERSFRAHQHRLRAGASTENTDSS